MLPVPAIVAMAQACAPAVSPKTLTAVVLAESGGDPLAIGVNGAKPYRLRPRDAADAVRIAQRLLVQGANFDLGLGQINSSNLKPLGLSAADAFDPCRNLGAAARVLTAYYRAASQALDVQAALRTSFSLYNTGDPLRGFRNGYVAKVSAAGRVIVPALDAAADATPSPPLPAPSPAPPSWDVFARTARGGKSFVIQPQSAEQSQ